MHTPSHIHIVSGGQTGVDRAGLDAALSLNLPCSGWCPKGRLAEDGPLDERYPLQETPRPQYPQRTEWNVRDSDGTLILTPTPPSGGTALTLKFAKAHAKPYLIKTTFTPTDVQDVIHWIHQEHIIRLNIAGPRESTCPIYDNSLDFLLEVLTQLSQGD